MNIGTVPFPTVGFAINASQGGKASLPVAPSAYIYSHFEHVSGVPTTEGENGVSINRLKIINTLIDHISQMKRAPEPLFNVTEQDNENRMNTLIDQYHNQIRDMHAANASNPYAPVVPFLGTVFSISA